MQLSRNKFITMHSDIMVVRLHACVQSRNFTKIWIIDNYYYCYFTYLLLFVIKNIEKKMNIRVFQMKNWFVYCAKGYIASVNE